MSRLTITLSEARYKALKEAAVQRDKTIGQLIDESLDFYGIKSRAGRARPGAPRAGTQQASRRPGAGRGAGAGSGGAAQVVSRQAVIVDTNVVVAGLLTGDASVPGGAHPRRHAGRCLPVRRVRGAAGRVPSRAGAAGPAQAAWADGGGGRDRCSPTSPSTPSCWRPGVGSPAPDPGDQLLWDLLAAKADLLLVTGDKLLLRDAAMQARVVSPQAFVAGAQPGRTMKIKGEPSA